MGAQVSLGDHAEQRASACFEVGAALKRRQLGKAKLRGRSGRLLSVAIEGRDCVAAKRRIVRRKRFSAGHVDQRDLETIDAKLPAHVDHFDRAAPQGRAWRMRQKAAGYRRR
jgi:hypothetical protein